MKKLLIQASVIGAVLLIPGILNAASSTSVTMETPTLLAHHSSYYVCYRSRHAVATRHGHRVLVYRGCFRSHVPCSHNHSYHRPLFELCASVRRSESLSGQYSETRQLTLVIQTFNLAKEEVGWRENQLFCSLYLSIIASRPSVALPCSKEATPGIVRTVSSHDKSSRCRSVI